MKKYFAVLGVVLSSVCNVALCDVSNVPSVNSIVNDTRDVFVNAKQQVLNVNVGCNSPVDFRVFQEINGQRVDVTEFFSIVSSIPDDGQITLIFSGGGNVGFSLNLNGDFIVRVSSFGATDDSRDIVARLTSH